MTGTEWLTVSLPSLQKNRYNREKENYTVQKAYDKKMGDYYIEIWGSYAGCNSENYIAMLRMPVQSIKESIAISNRFIAYVGLAVGCTSIVVAYVFSSYITKPVKELSNIAERVAEMDLQPDIQATIRVR